MVTKLHNWAGNYEYNAATVHYPETVEQLQIIVKQAKKVRVLGSRHSFNGIADTYHDLVSLEKLPRLIDIDHASRTVTISGNVTYGDLCPVLQREGFALHNLASLPHISVVGACMTATHGSGVHNQNLASAISAIEFINAGGEIVRFSRDQDGDQFAGVVVSLGALGIAVRVTLDLIPTFDVGQVVYENLPVAALDTHFDEIMSGAYSVSLFTHWNSDRIKQVWVKQRLGEDRTISIAHDYFGATPASVKMHPIAGQSAENCTDQFGAPGAWYERLPHFRIDAKPSAGNELQTEYFVARKDSVAAIHALQEVSDQFAPHLLVGEIRTIAADKFWLSPCDGQDCVAFHFTWVQDWPSVRGVLPAIEAQLAPFNARPHWGKLFTMPPQRVQSLYAKMAQFKQLIAQCDPDGKFRNEYLDSNLFGN